MACFSAAVSAGSLSSMPSSARVSDMRRRPSWTWMPISALTKAFRMECTLNRVAVSPHSSTMRPSTTITTASVTIVAE